MSDFSVNQQSLIQFLVLDNQTHSCLLHISYRTVNQQTKPVVRQASVNNLCTVSSLLVFPFTRKKSPSMTSGPTLANSFIVIVV